MLRKLQSRQPGNSKIPAFLQTDVLVVENKQEVFTAMIALKEGQGSLANAVIVALGTRAKCSRTLTFDH